MKTFSVVLLLLFSMFSYAGPLPPNDLSKEPLRIWLKDNWHTGQHRNLGYDSARTAMYSFIDKNSDGNIVGVYSGFTQRARNTTFLNPINAEHTVPQSWFNRRSPMKSDIHHLFPTHKDVNSGRGSLPFDEIEDSLTDNWYVSDGSNLNKISTIPANNIDAYSERNIGEAFEPPENHKGNLARAVYYFYTMYPDAAGDISRIADKDVLFQWHLNDPVDAAEKQRNDRIEERQGNRNPYIDHPGLVARAWGHDVNIEPGTPETPIFDHIKAMRTDIEAMGTSLDKLKARLVELENQIGGD